MSRYFHDRLDNGRVQIGDRVTNGRIEFFASKCESEHLFNILLLLDQRFYELEQKVENLSLKNGFE